MLPQVLSVGFYNKHGRFATDEELSALCNEMGVMDYAFCDIAAKFDQPKGVDNYIGKRLLWGDGLLNSGRVFDKDVEEILSHPNAVLAPSYKEALAFINSHITRSFLPEEKSHL